MREWRRLVQAAVQVVARERETESPRAADERAAAPAAPRRSSPQPTASRGSRRARRFGRSVSRVRPS